MKIKRTEEENGDLINTSPLVDILFILIIFFLVTASFHQEERDIRVNLPETDTTLSSAVKVMVINVRSDGSYFLGDRRVNLDSLQGELIQAVELNPAQKVLIRGDRNALHGQVAAALAACRRVGVREANIGYTMVGG